MNELEDALLARWDRETLLVYADALQAAGDPRGELIALDLEIAERGVTPELAQRRRKRLYEWLGGSTIGGRPIHEAAFRYGFATDVHATHTFAVDVTMYLEAMFASPAGRYIRGLRIWVGTPRLLREAFAVLVREPRPWLERLEISIHEPGDDRMSEKLVRAVIAATPRLHTLSLHGAEGLVQFPHPAVRRLDIESPRLALAATIPHLETLGLVLDGDDRDDNEAGYDPAVISALHALATLRVLDLSRNEPYFSSEPADGLYPLVRWLPLDRLARLRLPSLRTPQQVMLLGQAVELARDTHFEIARTYAQHGAALADVSHPRLHLPAPYPWPPTSTLSSREALTITVPTEEYGDDVSLTQLIDQLEDQWDELPPNARAAWLEFWDFLADLPWEDAQGHVVTWTFPAATLLIALEPFDDFIPSTGTHGLWSQLAEKLRAAELPPDAIITVRRYWGW